MTVHLVGAGPGDPELLTVRAAALLADADVVLYDRLVHPDVLALAPPGAELIDVGRRPGDPESLQSRIHAILIEKADRYDTVVRLKGGDPYVFGRGGEDEQVLRDAGVDVEVTPGISSAIAAPAAAGIPVTLRGVSSGFTVVTGHQDPATDRHLDWDALARLGTTLVVLMGASRAGILADRLVAAGMEPSTPVAVVSDATLPTQEVHRTTLAGLGELPVRAPATIVIGEVAASSGDEGRLGELATAALSADGGSP